MSNIFNLENPFFSFLSKLCDIVFLSIIWVVFCIPVVTIGSANTALYYATVKVIRRERGYLFREFFKSFKMNFKRATIIGLILTVLYVILFIDITAARSAISSSQSFNSILFGIYLAIAFFVGSITVYIFPLLSRFDMTVKQLFKAALFISLRHLPFTILMIVVLAAAVVGVIIIPILILIIPAVATLVLSLMMERVLKKYMPKSETEEENSGKDEWYME